MKRLPIQASRKLLTAAAASALLVPLHGQWPWADVQFNLVSPAVAAESSGHTDKGGEKGGKAGGGHATGGSSSAGHSSGGSSAGHSSGSSGAGHSTSSSSGGHTGGASSGHSGGAGSKGHSAGGDSGSHAGGKSGGHAGGGSGHKGGEKAMHGLRPDHAGHASGQHQSAEHKGRRHGAASSHNDHEFAGGSGLSASMAVPEGLAATSLPSASFEVATADSHGQARERHSFGPGPQYQRRLRYWGGRNVDDDDDGDDGGDDDGTTPGSGGGGPITAYLMEAGGRCDDHIAGKLRGWERMSGKNFGRIDTIIGRYAPEVKGSRYMSAAHLVANYQQEVEKKDPDATLAGTYLGLIAGDMPITAQMVKEVNFGLCVVVDDSDAREIAVAAEIQRLAAK